MWRNKDRQPLAVAMTMAISAAFGGCEANLGPGFTRPLSGNGSGGIVVADEPQAVLIAREVLGEGGSAADAAVTLGFALSVTLQSAAGIGGGGLCLVYDSEDGEARLLDFMPPPAIGRSDSARWQVAVPALARGLYALHAEYGQLPWQQVVVPAENHARFSHVVSRAFAEDLLIASDALVNDPKALDVFMSSRRVFFREGERVEQIDLAATLGRIRGKTPADFYTGDLARKIDTSSDIAGTSLSIDDLREFSPQWRSPSKTKVQGTTIHMSSEIDELEESTETIVGKDKASAGTGFVTADMKGNVVACSLTMIEPFGVGLMPDGLGFLMAPSPELPSSDMPFLAAGILVDNKKGQVRYAAAAVGEMAGHVIKSFAHNIADGGQGGAAAESLASGEAVATEEADINSVYCEGGIQSNLAGCRIQNNAARHGYGLVLSGQ